MKPRYLLYCGLILLCVQLSKISQNLLFMIIYILSTHFAINILFAQLENVKNLQNNDRTVNVNERIREIQTKA